MGEKIKVTLGDIERSASQIQDKNQCMHDEFTNVDNAINVDLSSKIDGRIKEHILWHFNDMKSTYVDRRFNYLDAYQKFLVADVSHNYRTVEKANKEAVEYLR